MSKCLVGVFTIWRICRGGAVVAAVVIVLAMCASPVIKTSPGCLGVRVDPHSSMKIPIGAPAATVYALKMEILTTDRQGCVIQRLEPSEDIPPEFTFPAGGGFIELRNLTPTRQNAWIRTHR